MIRFDSELQARRICWACCVSKAAPLSSPLLACALPPAPPHLRLAAVPAISFPPSAKRTLSVSLVGLILLGVPLFPADRLAVAQETATKPASEGVIEGQVKYVADAKRPWRYARYYVKRASQGFLAEAVVGLRGGDLKQVASPPRPPVVVNQKDYRFIPETVAVRVGESVRFTNSDVSVHNVMTYDGRKPFNVNTLMGDEYTHTFDQAGGVRQPFRIACSYHSQMRAWIYVFSHPFFQVTGEDGAFRFDHVPPGEYDLEVAHPAGSLRSSQRIVVRPGEVAKVELRLTPDQLVEKP